MQIYLLLSLPLTSIMSVILINKILRPNRNNGKLSMRSVDRYRFICLYVLIKIGSHQCETRFPLSLQWICTRNICRCCCYCCLLLLLSSCIKITKHWSYNKKKKTRNEKKKSNKFTCQAHCEMLVILLTHLSSSTETVMLLHLWLLLLL